mgnify:CR=1 FL=1
MQCVDLGGRRIIKKTNPPQPPPASPPPPPRIPPCCPIFFKAEDGIRDVERSRGLGDVYKRQHKLLTLPKSNGIRINNRF